MKTFLLPLVAFIALASIARGEEYSPSPDTIRIFREQWADINATLERSAAIRAEHARQREIQKGLQQLRQDSAPLPPEWMVNPRYMTPATPPPSMIQTPSGDLYHFYGNMIQGPHGELYTIY